MSSAPPLARPAHPSATPPTERSDESILRGCRRGEPGAFAELYRRYGPDARRFARSLVSADDVDDVVAESFTKILRALRSGRGPVDQPIRYIIVTVRSTAATLHARRAKADRTVHRLHLVGEATGPAFTVTDDDLVAAFRTLSPRWRQVIWWTEIEGRPPAEVAERLGINAAAASALAYRARRALRLAYLREQRRSARAAS